MPYSRAILPVTDPSARALTAAMASIGMVFSSDASHDQTNIEDTLLHASREGIENDDTRVLAILVTWFGVHAAYVNADRLTKIVASQTSDRICALWSALAHWHRTDRRFSRLESGYQGSRIDVLRVGSAFQIRRHGEDPRFAESVLRVPANLLRSRPADVLTPAQLARRHVAYRYRLMFGPTYRADLWAALDNDPQLSTTALARQTYASFATAWTVRRDHKILSTEK